MDAGNSGKLKRRMMIEISGLTSGVVNNPIPGNVFFLRRLFWIQHDWGEEKKECLCAKVVRMRIRTQSAPAHKVNAAMTCRAQVEGRFETHTDMHA